MRKDFGPDPLIQENVYFSDIEYRVIHSLLYQYNYELPFVTAECFLLMYHKHVLCGAKVNYSLFRPFIKYRKRTCFLFKPIIVNDFYTKKVKLDGIRMKDLSEMEYTEFLMDNPQFNGFHYETTTVDLTPEDVEDMDGLITYRDEDDTRYDFIIKIISA